MKNAHDSYVSGGRRPVNVTVQASVLKEAKALGINISQITDSALIEAIRAEKKRRFLEENNHAINAHNAWIDQQGMLITPMWIGDNVTF
jgi:antitoxin CcdA